MISFLFAEQNSWWMVWTSCKCVKRESKDCSARSTKNTSFKIYGCYSLGRVVSVVLYWKSGHRRQLAILSFSYTTRLQAWTATAAFSLLAVRRGIPATWWSWDVKAVCWTVFLFELVNHILKRRVVHKKILQQLEYPWMKISPWLKRRHRVPLLSK